MADLENVNNLDASQRSHNPINKGDINVNQHKLSVAKPQVTKRARSPVTVQEWVAALPDKGDDEVNGDADNKEDEVEEVVEDVGETDLVLGAEAGYAGGNIITSNVAKMLLQRHHNTAVSGQARHLQHSRPLQHSDTAASFRSNLSHLSSVSSVDSAVLQSRKADPEEILYNLGFGGSDQLSRIPARFLRHKSVARGITVESFMAKQEDVDTMVEFGFAGYRGLHGSPNRRPSEIVEKILNTLVQNDKELRRRNSCQSWSTSSSFIPGVGGIPSRFRVMDPRRKTFQSIVEEVRKPRKVPKVTTPSKRSFKNVAQTVLLDDKLDEDLEDEKSESYSDTQVSDIENSDDSDWSDEEKEELEKMFGAMSTRAQRIDRVRRVRKSIRRSRRKADVNGDFARLVFSREAFGGGGDSDTTSIADSGSILSCDTYCDKNSDIVNDISEDVNTKIKNSDIPTLSFTCHVDI